MAKKDFIYITIISVLLVLLICFTKVNKQENISNNEQHESFTEILPKMVD